MGMREYGSGRGIRLLEVHPARASPDPLDGTTQPNFDRSKT